MVTLSTGSLKKLNLKLTQPNYNNRRQNHSLYLKVNQWSASCGSLSNFEWAVGYLLLFQFYKVVVGRVIAAAYIHCSLKVGVAKSFSFGLLLHHSSIACRFLKYW